MGGYTAREVIDKVLHAKEVYHKGFLHFQLSINSTNEDTRKELFGVSVKKSLKVESMIIVLVPIFRSGKRR